MESRGQTAIEYLTTYGWLIILLVAAVGALGYFGYLDLDTFKEEECWFGAQLICKDHALTNIDETTSRVFIQARNDFDRDIELMDITPVDPDVSISGCNIPVNISRGRDRVIQCTLNRGLPADDKTSVGLSVTFRNNESPSPTHVVRGQVFSKVLQGDPSVPECSDGVDNDFNGCADYEGGDTGCSGRSDQSEGGGDCSGTPDVPLDCFVTDICPEIEVVRMADETNTHAEMLTQSNFAYSVCCRSPFDTLSTSCADETPVRLSNYTDAHVQDNTVGTYSWDACLSASTGTISCRYESGGSCLASETCFATISDATDGHVSDCSSEPLNIRICCELT